jgi:7-keto-8-aminopelargonate synthetase-like enzyme
MDKMKAYPLAVLNLVEAKEKQFRLIDMITKKLYSAQRFCRQVTLALVAGYGKPSTTAKVEKTLADFFGTEAAVLVRGAGTAAIRWGLWSMMTSGQALVVHKAPIYPTTKVTVESMHLQVVQADYNNIPALKKALLEEPVEAGTYSACSSKTKR